MLSLHYTEMATYKKLPFLVTRLFGDELFFE